MWGIPSFWNVDVNAWQEGNDVIVRMEEKAFLPIATQKRMGADISLVEIGGTNKQYYICKIRRVHERMLSEDITVSSAGESFEVPPTVLGDCGVGGS